MRCEPPLLVVGLANLVMKRIVRVSFSNSCLQKRKRTKKELAPALFNMIRHSNIGSIACSLATLFILLSPVTGYGYAFDTASCSPQAIAFLTIQIKRAVTTGVNTANVLNQGQLPDDINDPIVFMMNDDESFNSLISVFIGGQVSNINGQPGQVQQVEGIGSYTQVLPSFDSSDPTATIAADTPGNLVLIQAIPSI